VQALALNVVLPYKVIFECNVENLSGGLYG